MVVVPVRQTESSSSSSCWSKRFNKLFGNKKRKLQQENINIMEDKFEEGVKEIRRRRSGLSTVSIAPTVSHLL